MKKKNVDSEFVEICHKQVNGQDDSSKNLYDIQQIQVGFFHQCVGVWHVDIFTEIT